MVKLVDTRDLKSLDASRAGSIPAPGTNTETSESGSGNGAFPCGSGLGRDRAVAIRKLRCRLRSGSEDPSHTTLTQAQVVALAHFPVGAALAATGPLRSASFDAGCGRGQKTPPTKPRLRPRAGAIPVGAAWAATGSLQATCSDSGRKCEPSPPAPLPLMRARGADGAAGPSPASAGEGGAQRRVRGLGLDAGRCRGQKTPSKNPTAPTTEPPLKRTRQGFSPTCLHGPRLRNAPDAAGLV